MLRVLALLVNERKGYRQAAAVAFAADGPGGMPGKQLAVHLLGFLTRLAEARPPAMCCAAPAANAAGTGAAEAAAAVAARDDATAACWDYLLALLTAADFEPYLTVQAARGQVGSRLLSQLGSLLERLRLRQQAASGAPAALSERALQAQLIVAAAACTVTSNILGSYSTVLRSLLPEEEPGQCEQLQGSLLQAVEKALLHASDALHAAPHAAAVLTAAAGASAHTGFAQASFGQCCHGFDAVMNNAGEWQILGLGCMVVV